MEIEKYLQERIEDQIFYYSKASSRFKLYYLTIMSLQILLGVYLPICAKIGFVNYELQISIVGGLIVILAGLQGLINFKEKWINYRKAAERLKQEKFKFLCLPENIKAEIFLEFVMKMEDLFANENNNWSNISMKETTSVSKQ